MKTSLLYVFICASVVFVPAVVCSASKYEKINSTQPADRADAVNALGQENKKENIPTIAKMLEDIDLEVQKAAIKSLAKIQDSQAVTILIDKFKSTKEEEIKMAVLSGLGELKSDTAVPFLKTLLKDTYPSFRAGSLSALGKINSPGTHADIVNMISDDTEVVRLTAAKLSGILKIDSAVPVLLKRLNDPVITVRTACIDSLGQIGGNSAATALKRLLKNKNRAIVEAAKKALENIKTEKKDQGGQ